MNKITTAAIQLEIAEFGLGMGKQKDHAHKIAMMILNHAAPEKAGPDAQGSGNCSTAPVLASKMPTSWSKQLTQWFKINSPIRLKGDKVAFCEDYKNLKVKATMTDEEIEAIQAEKLTWWNLENASINPFHEINKGEDKPIVLLDLEGLGKFIETQAKNLEKKAEDGKIDGQALFVSAQVVKALRELKALIPDAQEVGENVNLVGDLPF